MKTSRLIMTAAGAYIFFLLLLTPASTLLSLISLPPHIKLSGVSGSIWSGQANSLSLKTQSFNNIIWSLNPLSLFTASLSSDLKADVFNNTVNTEVDYSLLSRKLTLTNLSSEIKAADIMQQISLPVGELEGTVRINADSVAVIPGEFPVIKGVISWKNASLLLGQKMEFGDLFLRLSEGEEGGIKADISNLKGQLSITGLLTVSNKQIYSLTVKLKPRTNAPEELLSMLRLVAPAKKGGDHIITRSGHLRQLGIKL